MSVSSSIEILLLSVISACEVAELLDTGDGGGLGADALLDVAVGAQGVDVVVERGGALRSLCVEQAALLAGGHRHPDRVADALAERPRGDLDAGGVAVLRVARGERTPCAQRLEVVELQPEPAEVELDVLREARVAAGEDETITADPSRVGRVVAHHLLEQQVGHRGEAHRGAGVAVADLLHRVHRQHPARVHRPLVELGPVERGREGELLCGHGDPLGVERVQPRSPRLDCEPIPVRG